MVRKTDNDGLLAVAERPVEATQIALPLGIKSVEKPLTELEQKQRANFEAFCADLRRETALKLAIAQSTFPEEAYTDLKAVKNEHWAEVNRQYQEHPFKLGRTQWPHPEIEPDYAALGQELHGHEPEAKPVDKAKQVYKPWSQERRQQHAVRGLLSRVQKRSSFPDLWIDWAFEEIEKDPWRYGVCPLPGTADSCPIPNPDRILAKQKAVALEVQFREQEQGLVMPLSIPLNQPEPEYALLANQELSA